MPEFGNTLAEAFVRIGVDVSGLERGLMTIRTKTESMSTSLNQMSATVSKFALAAGAAVGGLVQRFASLEQSMLEVKAVMGTALSESQFTQLTASAKEMGATTAFSSKQAADALINLSRAGFTADQQLDLLPNTLNLASAGGLEIAQASDIVAKAVRGMGLEASDATMLVDVLAKASSTANTDIAQLGGALEKVGRVGIEQGRSMNELVSAIQILADAGFQGSEGGNALRRILGRLVAPSKEAKSLMDEIGFSAANADGTLKPLGQTFGDLSKAMAGMTDEQRAQTLNLIAGQQAIAQLSTLLSAGEDVMTSYEERLGDVAGTSDQMRQTMESGIIGQFKLMMSAVDAAATALGERLAPAARQVMEFVADLAGRVQSFVENNPAFAELIGKGTIALGGLAVALGTASTALGVIVVGLKAFTSVGFIAAVNAMASAVSGLSSLFINLGIEMSAIVGGGSLLAGSMSAVGLALPTIAIGLFIHALMDLYDTLARVEAQTQKFEDVMNAGTEAIRERTEAINKEINAKKESKEATEEEMQTELDRLKLERDMAAARMNSAQGLVNQLRNKERADLEGESKMGRKFRKDVVEPIRGLFGPTDAQNIININEQTANAERERLSALNDLIDALEKKKQLEIDAAEEAKNAAKQGAAEQMRAAQELQDQLDTVITKWALARDKLRQTDALIAKTESESQPMQTSGLASFNQSIQQQLAPTMKRELEELQKIRQTQQKQVAELEKQTRELEKLDPRARFEGSALSPPSGE